MLVYQRVAGEWIFPRKLTILGDTGGTNIHQHQLLTQGVPRSVCKAETQMIKRRVQSLMMLDPITGSTQD